MLVGRCDRASPTHLEAVRLIGEDLELRPPRYRAARDPHRGLRRLRPTGARICASCSSRSSRTAGPSDGRRGFFHPDEWTFGQSLHRSAIEGRIHASPASSTSVSITMKRFNAPTPGVPELEMLEMGFDEVVLLANDPDHLERGLIRFDVHGGRQWRSRWPAIR